MITSNAGESARKWRPMPGELVSLWDMIQHDAYRFVLLLRAIDEAASSLKGNEKQANLSEAEQLAEVKIALVGAETACRELEIDSGLDRISRLRQQIEKTGIKDLGIALQVLPEVIQDELKRRTFFFVPSRSDKYLANAIGLFGKVVIEKFPSTTEDIAGAGRCLAVGCYTAAVFHLMRIMEVGVQRFAKRLKIPANKIENKPWGAILNELNTAINALPAKAKKRKDRYSEMTAHLHNVKIAWRNPVMHPKRTYTQEEAEDIFAHVKTFMNYLATEVS